MKTLRFVGYAFGGMSAVYAGYYTVVYLTRWEWQRALISAALLIVVEVFLATVLLLTRLARLESRIEASDARVEEVRRRLEQSRSPRPHRFNWLSPMDRTSLNGAQRTFVFVPVLMVAGAALSGLALVIQKIAGATARPGAERRLAGRLTALTAPSLGEGLPGRGVGRGVEGGRGRGESAPGSAGVEGWGRGVLGGSAGGGWGRGGGASGSVGVEGRGVLGGVAGEGREQDVGLPGSAGAEGRGTLESAAGAGREQGATAPESVAVEGWGRGTLGSSAGEVQEQGAGAPGSVAVEGWGRGMVGRWGRGAATPGSWGSGWGRGLGRVVAGRSGASRGRGRAVSEVMVSGSLGDAVPPARVGRKLLAVTAGLAGLLLVPLLWSALADATQTRAEEAPRAASTTMVFRVDTYGDKSATAVRLAAQDLWETCRRSTAAQNSDANLSALRDGVYTGVIRPALPSHDVMRLRGCLEDANTNRASAVVLGEGQAESR